MRSHTGYIDPFVEKLDLSVMCACRLMFKGQSHTSKRSRWMWIWSRPAVRCVEGQTEKIACCSATAVIPGETFTLSLCPRHSESCLTVKVYKTHKQQYYVLLKNLMVVCCSIFRSVVGFWDLRLFSKAGILHPPPVVCLNPKWYKC